LAAKQYGLAAIFEKSGNYPGCDKPTALEEGGQANAASFALAKQEVGGPCDREGLQPGAEETGDFFHDQLITGRPHMVGGIADCLFTLGKLLRQVMVVLMKKG